MKPPSRTRQASNSGYVQVSGRKILRRCPKCDAAPGWRCRIAIRKGDGIVLMEPTKRMHKER